MRILHLVWRQITYRLSISFLMIFSIAIASALLTFITITQAAVVKGAAKGYGPFELVIGAKGSPTQLAMNTLYYIGAPVGNIAYEVLEQLKRHEGVDEAFAITKGDSYKNYPIVGLDKGYFSVRYPKERLASGRGNS